MPDVLQVVYEYPEKDLTSDIQRHSSEQLCARPALHGR